MKAVPLPRIANASDVAMIGLSGEDHPRFAPSRPTTSRCDLYRPSCVDGAARTSGPSVSSTLAGFKRVDLHYIAFSELAIAKTRLASHPNSKIAEIGTSATNIG
jgi:hypothetical protein